MGTLWPLKINTKNASIIESYPKELWEVDLIRQMQSETLAKKKYIFIRIDHFTQWDETATLSNKTEGLISRPIQTYRINKYRIQKLDKIRQWIGIRKHKNQNSGNKIGINGHISPVPSSSCCHSWTTSQPLWTKSENWRIMKHKLGKGNKCT